MNGGLLVGMIETSKRWGKWKSWVEADKKEVAISPSWKCFDLGAKHHECFL